MGNARKFSGLYLIVINLNNLAIILSLLLCIEGEVHGITTGKLAISHFNFIE